MAYPLDGGGRWESLRVVLTVSSTWGVKASVTCHGGAPLGVREILCRDPVPISLQVVSITFILYLYTLTDDYLCSARDGWLLASAEAPVALPWLARGWLGVIEDTFASPVSRLRLRCFPRCGYRVDRGEWFVRLLVSRSIQVVFGFHDNSSASSGMNRDLPLV